MLKNRGMYVKDFFLRPPGNKRVIQTTDQLLKIIKNVIKMLHVQCFFYTIFTRLKKIHLLKINSPKRKGVGCTQSIAQSLFTIYHYTKKIHIKTLTTS